MWQDVYDALPIGTGRACSGSTSTECPKAFCHCAAHVSVPIAASQSSSVQEELHYPRPQGSVAVCNNTSIAHCPPSAAAVQHKISTTGCPKVVCLCFAALGGSSTATLTPGCVGVCSMTFTAQESVAMCRNRSIAHYPPDVCHCAEGVQLPTYSRQCGNVRQDFNCPLPENSVGDCSRSSAAH